MGRGKYDTCENCINYKSKTRNEGFCMYSRKTGIVEKNDWCNKHESLDEEN